MDRWSEIPKYYQPDFGNCSHRVELRRLVCSNGSIQYKKQCLICGSSQNPIAHKSLSAEQKRTAPPLAEWDSEYRKLWRELVKERQRAWYENYLASEAWATKRAYILDRDMHTCRCGWPATEVHHKTYDRIGHEDPDDLVSLCRDCHAMEHPRRFEDAR